MIRYVFCSLALFGIFSIHGQSTAAKICWDTTWYNNSAPTKTNRSDYEHQSAKVLDSICTNGKVIDAQCKDQKGEPFKTFKDDSVNEYIATCSVTTGLICNPYNNTNATCPDFEINYGCACVTTASSANTRSPSGGVSTSASGTGGSVTGRGSSSSSSGGSGNNGDTNKQHGDCGNSARGNLVVGNLGVFICLCLKLFI